MNQTPVGVCLFHRRGNPPPPPPGWPTFAREQPAAGFQPKSDRHSRRQIDERDLVKV